MNEWENKWKKDKQKFAPLLTDELLRTLVAVARTYGHSGDYIEVVSFVQYCFDLADKPYPDLTPFKED